MFLKNQSRRRPPARHPRPRPSPSASAPATCWPTVSPPAACPLYRCVCVCLICPFIFFLDPTSKRDRGTCLPVRLILRNKTPPRSTLIVVGTASAPFLSWRSNSLRPVRASSSPSPTAAGRFGGFRGPAAVNRAAVRVEGRHLFQLVFWISSGEWPEAKFLGHVIDLFLIFLRTLCTVFRSGCTDLQSHQQSAKCSTSLAIGEMQTNHHATPPHTLQNGPHPQDDR